MKIFFVVNTLDLKIACDLMRELSARHQVTVATILGIGSDFEKQSLEQHGVRIIDLQGPRNKIKFLMRLPSLIRTLRTHLIEAQPEVLHTHFWLSEIVGFSAARPLSVRKRISTQHDLVPLSFPIAWLKRRALRHADTVAAISKSAAQMLETRFCVPRRKICVIHNGIVFSAFEKGKKPDKEWLPVFGMVARLEPIKGVDIFLEALTLLQRRKVAIPRAIIIGGGSQQADLEHYVQTHQLPVEFRGAQTDILPDLAAIDVVVVPSRSEGLSVAILESLASSKLVVASSVGGILDLIHDRENGLLSNPTAEGFADALEWVLKNKTAALKLRSQGYAWIKERQTTFDIMNTAEQYEKIYQ